MKKSYNYQGFGLPYLLLRQNNIHKASVDGKILLQRGRALEDRIEPYKLLARGQQQFWYYYKTCETQLFSISKSLYDFWTILINISYKHYNNTLSLFLPHNGSNA